MGVNNGKATCKSCIPLSRSPSWLGARAKVASRRSGVAERRLDARSRRAGASRAAILRKRITPSLQSRGGSAVPGTRNAQPTFCADRSDASKTTSRIGTTHRCARAGTRRPTRTCAGCSRCIARTAHPYRRTRAVRNLSERFERRTEERRRRSDPPFRCISEVILVYWQCVIGAVAQLGERVNGIHEVRGSIPLSSTRSEEKRSNMKKWLGK